MYHHFPNKKHEEHQNDEPKLVPIPLPSGGVVSVHFTGLITEDDHKFLMKVLKKLKPSFIQHPTPKEETTPEVQPEASHTPDNPTLPNEKN